MKYYHLNDEDWITYILSHRIEKYFIFVRLANYMEYKIPFTESKEEEIIQKMESQERDAKVSPMLNRDKILIVMSYVALPMLCYCFIRQPG